MTQTPLSRSKVKITRPLWLFVLAGQHGHTVMMILSICVHDVHRVTICRPGRGHIVAAAGLQLVDINDISGVLELKGTLIISKSSTKWWRMTIMIVYRNCHEISATRCTEGAKPAPAYRPRRTASVFSKKTLWDSFKLCFLVVMSLCACIHVSVCRVYKLLSSWLR